MITAESILRDLEAYTYARVSLQHPEKLALACAKALFECLYLNYRGQYLYIPNTDKDALLEKYAAIWNDFNGRNHAELSIRYHRSVQQIYSIIKAMRTQQIRQRQSDLFPLPEEKPVKPLVLTVLEDYLPADLQRAGLPGTESHALAKQIADYLCATYPGLQIRITESLWARRNRHEGDLFNQGEAGAI
jgi:Mor family transcriptional regulator